ncbi:O-antigen translocase [Acinetobacter variabilis]|uniref:O-antigen translocase n=1 Tax=Acinetobacter variabilis TaxID=70346 RepID=UPI0028ACABE6|nr:O-antigen translocase [Acinetobacter variabilis]
MNLFRTSVLNGVAVLIKTITMFVLNKILAVYLGPTGYAAIGQFQNFIQMVTTFAGSAINTAVVKYTAEYHEDETKQRAVWKTAGSIVFLFSFVFAILILIFQKQLALYIFQSLKYQTIFIWFAIFLIFFNFNTLFLAILNGKKEILKLVLANIAGSLFALVITGVLAIKLQLYGALIALSIYQSIAFVVTLILCHRADWFEFSSLLGKIDLGITKKFASFILLLVTTTLGVYYLPRLSELNAIDEIKKEVYLGYKFIFPLAVVGGICVFILRDWIIKLLFSPSFAPMQDLFLWQMMGDALKIGSWILAYLMLSKAMTKLYICTEIIFTVSLIALTYICTQVFGFEGVSIAHLINYGLYWIVISLFIFKQLK